MPKPPRKPSRFEVSIGIRSGFPAVRWEGIGALSSGRAAAEEPLRAGSARAALPAGQPRCGSSSGSAAARPGSPDPCPWHGGARSPAHPAFPGAAWMSCRSPPSAGRPRAVRWHRDPASLRLGERTAAGRDAPHPIATSGCLRARTWTAQKGPQWQRKGAWL